MSSFFLPVLSAVLAIPAALSQDMSGGESPSAPKAVIVDARLLDGERELEKYNVLLPVMPREGLIKEEMSYSPGDSTNLAGVTNMDETVSIKSETPKLEYRKNFVYVKSCTMTDEGVEYLTDTAPEGMGAVAYQEGALTMIKVGYAFPIKTLDKFNNGKCFVHLPKIDQYEVMGALNKDGVYEQSFVVGRYTLLINSRSVSSTP